MLQRFRKSSQRVGRVGFHAAGTSVAHAVPRRLMASVSQAARAAAGVGAGPSASAAAAAGTSAGARSGAGAGAGAGAGRFASASSAVRRGLSFVAAGSLAAAGVMVATHNQRTARAEPADGAGAVLPPSPAVAAPTAPAVAAAPDFAPIHTPGNPRVRTGLARGDKNAKDVVADPFERDPHAPTYTEIGMGARTVTEFTCWNGADIRIGYTPIPHNETGQKDVQIVHHFALGSPLSKEDEPTAHYDLTAVVADSTGNLLRASVSEGGVDGMAKHTYVVDSRNRLESQVMFQVSGDDQHPGVANLEADWKGYGYTVDASYRTQPSVAQLGFVQNIPWRKYRFALGAELGHAFDNQNTALSYAGRMRRGLEDGSEQWSFNVQTWSYGILSYQRAFADKNPRDAQAAAAAGIPPKSTVTLASDLHYNVNEHIALLSAGVEYRLEGMFTAKAMANTNSQISSTLEVEMGPAVKASLCGDVRHSENKYQFGVGLNVGTGQ